MCKLTICLSRDLRVSVACSRRIVDLRTCLINDQCFDILVTKGGSVLELQIQHEYRQLILDKDFHLRDRAGAQVWHLKRFSRRP